MSQPLNSTGNPPVDLDAVVPLALAIVMKAPFLANETLYKVAGLLLAGPVSDNTTIDGFVKLVEGFLPKDNQISNLRELSSSVFKNVPHIRSYVVEVVKAMPSGQDQRPFIREAVWTTLAITGLVLLGRIWSRYLLMRKLLLCDWVIILGYAMLAAFSAMCQVGTQIGVGLHVWDCSLHNIIKAAKLAYFGELLYRPALLAVKLSLLLFYPTLCRDRPFLFAVHIVTVIQLLHFVAGQFAIIFQCYPVDFWNHLYELHCTDRYTSYMFLGATNVVLDAAIFALPLYIVYKLQMTPREKIMSALLFCIGGSVCIVSALRIESLRGLTRGLDFTWVEARAGVYCALEVNIAIVCASIPSIRALVGYYAMPKAERHRNGSVGNLRRPSTSDSGGSLEGSEKKHLRGGPPRSWRPRWRQKPGDRASSTESFEAAPPPVAGYPQSSVVTTCEAVYSPDDKRRKKKSIASMATSGHTQLEEFCVEYEKRVEILA